MQQSNRQVITRRSFLKGLGALALTALPACRRAQQYAIEPESCPEWQLPGEATCFATSMPWAGGAIPMLAVCHGGLPTMLQPNPHYATQHPGLPAFAQASLTDLYSPARTTPTFNGTPYPAQGMQGAFRAWGTALRNGRKVAFLFPAGYSVLRAAQVEEFKQFSGAAFYEYDPIAEPRHSTFPELDALITHTLGPALRYPTGHGTLTELTAALPELDVLFIFTPADPAALHPEFAEALRHCRAETIRFCATAPDITAGLCRYTVPQTHFLEEWGAEADAYGNLCLRQPVTLPLVPAVSEAEALHSLLHRTELPLIGRADSSPIREVLLNIIPDAETLLRRGFAAERAPKPEAIPSAEPAADAPVLYLHPFFADGRFSHNPWLRETRFPLSGFTGAAEAFIPAAANTIGSVQVNGHTLPACGVPDLQRICLPLCAATVGAIPTQVGLEPTLPHSPASPLPPRCTEAPPKPTNTSVPQWALIIDTSLCDGCGACTLACRAENNIPTVGLEDIANHRDLQWLNIKRYRSTDGSLHYLPSACRQCENAPCEAVCPVHATVHTDEGLNAMVYPRCWGTRYCSAACPYEARHFNYRDYSRQAQASTRTPTNPQVSVRTRGVMEKCTYCVQRLNAHRRSKSSDLPQTACQQACPRGAIRLIDLRHHAPAEVITSFDAPGTRPRTLYI